MEDLSLHTMVCGKYFLGYHKWGYFVCKDGKRVEGVMLAIKPINKVATISRIDKQYGTNFITQYFGCCNPPKDSNVLKYMNTKIH